MNIFAGLKYEPLWNVTYKRSLTREEKAIVENAEVAESDFGFSVCFHLKNGESPKIPLSTASYYPEIKVGDAVNIETLSILTLHRSYDDAKIYRIEL